MADERVRILSCMDGVPYVSVMLISSAPCYESNVDVIVGLLFGT